MKFILNGQEREYTGDSELSLLKYLREHEGLISMKDGCSPQASCGCCTVELDNKAVLSCVTPMKKVDGKSVLTIEGIGDYLQNVYSGAFVEKGGVQCGYCTPGIVMRAKNLVDSKPEPTKEDIDKALQFHLCRCTGYKKINDSIMYAAEAIKENKEIPVSKNNGKIGTRQPKYDSHKTVLGLRPFVCDIKIENMAHGALKFSDYPRAKVLSVDITEAEKLEDIIKVFLPKDIPGERFTGQVIPDWPLMIAEGEETRYIGDVIAGVVAKNENIARKALQLIKVDYEILTPLTDPHEAMKDDAYKIHEKGNILSKSIIKRGDAEEELKNSEFVVNGIYQTQTIEHAFMEPECCVAETVDDGIKIYTQGQGVYVDQRQISTLLGLEKEKVDVVLVPNGGAFGGKEDLTVQGHAALFSYILKRPVKVLLTRDESIRMHPKRHPLWMDYTLASDKDGKLTVLKAKIIGDTGAYASVGMKVLERAAGHSTGAYHVPVVDVESIAVYTNNIPNGAMRGFGANQANFALESCIDELCEKGNFDRWQFRYDNALIDGSTIATGQVLEGGVGVRETLLALKNEFYNAKYAGIACGLKNTGVGNGMSDTGKVKITVESPESIVVRHGWTEMGQGVHTIAQQVVCEETGFPPESVKVIVETKDGCYSGMTTSSRATSIVGNSLIDACKKLNEALKTKKIEELTGNVYSGEWTCDWTTKPGKDDGKATVTHFSYSYATQVVTLDDQGNVEKIYAAHDAGKIMNPLLFEGQIEGSLHMGLGYALTEELILENGYPITTKLRDCGVLRAKDTPEFIVKGVEVKDPHGAYGCKGVGEIGLVPTAPAVTNALYQFDKIRRYSLPVKSKRRN